MNSSMHQKIFLNFKPICDDIIQSPTPENLRSLTQLLANVPSVVFQDLSNYVALPVIVHLENKSLGHSEDLRKDLVNTLKEIISIIKINDIKKFFKIYFSLCYQIFDKSSPGFVAPVHEELKLSVVTTIEILMKNVSFETIENLYTEKNVAELSHGIYLCIQIAKREKLRSLKVAALKCLMSLAYCHDEADQTDVVICSQVADILMNQLPGISSGLQEIMFDDFKQGHLVTLMALRAWGRIVTLIMKDEIVQNEISCDLKIDLETKPADNSSKRNQNWCKETMKNLEAHIKSLRKLQSHSHSNVRLELVSVCELFVKKCIRNLANVFGYILDILIALSEDDYDDVEISSKNVLNIISNMYMKERNRSVSEVIEENFYNLIDKLPRVMNGSDESKQAFAMNLLIGYLRLLGDTNHILNSISQLQHLISALICISELQYSDVSLLEEYSLRNFDYVHGSDAQWKQFKNLSDKNMQNKFFLICNLLGQSDAIDILANHLLDLFAYEVSNRKEIILILNEILYAKNNKLDHKIVIIKNVLDEYLNPELWYLPTKVEDSQCTAVSEAKDNIICMCLLTEGIGKMALSVGKSFDKFLIKVLYFLLERAGSNLNLISASGINAIHNVSLALGYDDVKELLKANADYFEHYIITKLRRIERNIGVLDVLSVIMINCSLEVLPCLQHIVEDVLLQSCDTFKEYNLLSFLKVFNIFVTSVQKWQHENHVDTSEEILNIHQNSETQIEEDKEKELQELDNILKEAEMVEDEYKNKTAEEMYLEDLQKQKEQTDYTDEFTEDIKPKPPPEVELIASILKRSLHFLPVKEKDTKLLVLEILNKGVDVVQNWEDVLLPLVHLIWSPLEDRFKEISEPLIVHHSLLLLSTLAITSKDFIRHRTTKKIFPDLCNYLHKLSESSKRGVRNIAYSYSQVYKLQIALITNLSQIAIHLDVTDQHLKLVIIALIPYLSSLQPLPLQEACLNSLKALMSYNGKLTYETICSLCENVAVDMKKNISIVNATYCKSNCIIDTIDSDSSINTNVNNETCK